VAYLVSFLAIGGAWIAHAALTDRLARTNPVFLRLKRFVLLAVLMLPFPTRLLAEWFGEREAERVAVALFGVTLLVTRLAGVALDGYARSSGRSRSGRAPSEHGWSGSPTLSGGLASRLDAVVPPGLSHGGVRSPHSR